MRNKKKSSIGDRSYPSGVRCAGYGTCSKIFRFRLGSQFWLWFQFSFGFLIWVSIGVSIWVSIWVSILRPDFEWANQTGPRISASHFSDQSEVWNFSHRTLAFNRTSAFNDSSRYQPVIGQIELRISTLVGFEILGSTNVAAFSDKMVRKNGKTTPCVIFGTTAA